MCYSSLRCTISSLVADIPTEHTPAANSSAGTCNCCKVAAPVPVAAAGIAGQIHCASPVVVVADTSPAEAVADTSPVMVVDKPWEWDYSYS